jgi:hypothetical protein
LAEAAGIRIPFGSNCGIDPTMSQTAVGLAETAFKPQLQPSGGKPHFARKGAKGPALNRQGKVSNFHREDERRLRLGADDGDRTSPSARAGDSCHSHPFSALLGGSRRPVGVLVCPAPLPRSLGAERWRSLGAAVLPVIVAAIEKHARGDVEALARGITEELRVAGLEIRRTDAIPIRNPKG